MGRFFFSFFITLVIGYFSIFLATIAGGLLFFGKYAPLPSPEKVPYAVARLVVLAVNLFPGLLFTRWKARKDPSNSMWVWLGGLLASGIISVLALGLMFFSGAD
ncbi:MAG: hypothetical protein Q7J69_00055 [Candidatus Omnitrophota bacterium]|nr:hypothetical protein [Candidatus Omnitrophota bacterium]